MKPLQSHYSILHMQTFKVGCWLIQCMTNVQWIKRLSQQKLVSSQFSLQVIIIIILIIKLFLSQPISFLIIYPPTVSPSHQGQSQQAALWCWAAGWVKHDKYLNCMLLSNINNEVLLKFIASNSVLITLGSWMNEWMNECCQDRIWILFLVIQDYKTENWKT